MQTTVGRSGSPRSRRASAALRPGRKRSASTPGGSTTVGTSHGTAVPTNRCVYRLTAKTAIALEQALRSARRSPGSRAIHTSYPWVRSA